MSKLGIFVSGTIVLFLAHVTWASPSHEVPSTAGDEVQWPTGQSGDTMSVAEPPPVKFTAKPIDPGFYPYRQALTVRAGQGSKFPKIEPNELVLGFQYLFPKFLSPKLEAGADVHEDGKGHIHAGVRWYWWEKNYFRPSYKLSVDHLVDAKENLATFAEIKNYYIRGSGTLEYVFKNPWSIRLEPELLFNFNNQRLVLTLGVSRGW